MRYLEFFAGFLESDSCKGVAGVRKHYDVLNISVVL